MVQEAFRQRGGYSMETEVAKVLRGLGFAEEDWEKPCEQFSGGWQMRIALARLLLQRPNLLLLDEPTNHLDLPARDWLEAYLAAYPYAVVLVSHDRFFLDQVVTRIVEVWNGQLSEYPGNYSRYLEERDRRIGALFEAKSRQDEEIARIEAFISRFRYQANKASLVQSRVKQLEKIERIQVPPARRRIAFRFPAPPKGGRLTLELTQVAQGYGERTIFAGVDLAVEKGERIALVGANGAGKSTLMRILAGQEAPQAGTRSEGHNLHLAYFAQDQAKVLDPGRTVLEEITAAAPFEMVPRVRDILGSFLFSGDDVQKKVAVLSGGERNRLALANLLLRPANLLLLDEPTNHLDLQSKEVLLDSLKSYDGTLIFVSHDRYFVDALATRIIEVADGRIASYPGNYEDFLRAKGAAGENGHSALRVEISGGDGRRVPLQSIKRSAAASTRNARSCSGRKSAGRKSWRRSKSRSRSRKPNWRRSSSRWPIRRCIRMPTAGGRFPPVTVLCRMPSPACTNAGRRCRCRRRPDAVSDLRRRFSRGDANGRRKIVRGDRSERKGGRRQNDDRHQSGGLSQGAAGGSAGHHRFLRQPFQHRSDVRHRTAPGAVGGGTVYRRSGRRTGRTRGIRSAVHRLRA